MALVRWARRSWEIGKSADKSVSCCRWPRSSAANYSRIDGERFAGQTVDVSFTGSC